ncbi:MAG: hypothetical protein N0E59_00825 [Candidatus Thiodiazotropha taylori]|nr:hypothetical protein [Candidatus Thiodiazotropha taylori]MCG8109285.1 hypothetical protein [Candidatus Thiodiazotropha taylori]MCW4281623.1 hypothetical protein [Candidatus Thiodiazotropha taylori]MCW4303584.1 hypothetical protein [Candidatus Thiodiazotropha taylori]
MKQQLQQLDRKIDSMMHRVLNNIGKRKQQPNPLHEHVMHSAKRHNLKSFSEFAAQ